MIEDIELVIIFSFLFAIINAVVKVVIALLAGVRKENELNVIIWNCFCTSVALVIIIAIIIEVLYSLSFNVILALAATIVMAVINGNLDKEALEEQIKDSDKNPDKLAFIINLCSFIFEIIVLAVVLTI